MTRQGCGHPLSPVPTGAVCYRELSFPTTRKLKGSLLSSEAKKLNHLSVASFFGSPAWNP